VLMEPTLGAYLGVEFHHHHEHRDQSERKEL
jgi:hypothetical protein